MNVLIVFLTDHSLFNCYTSRWTKMLSRDMWISDVSRSYYGKFIIQRI